MSSLDPTVARYCKIAMVAMSTSARADRVVGGPGRHLRAERGLMDHVPAFEVAAVKPFGRIARLLAATHDVQGVLDEIVRLAVEHPDACDFAGISFVDGRRITSPAASSEAAALVDSIQAETNQGPCLDAIKHHEVFQTGDLSAEHRWPKFAAHAHASTGVRSILSLRLLLEADTYGSLNM